MLPQLTAADPHAFEVVWGLLDDASRRAGALGPAAAAACCRMLRDTVRADPRLWPAVVVRAPQPALLRHKSALDDGYAYKRFYALSRGERPPSGAPYFQGFLEWEAAARTQLLDDAARLSSQLDCVRLEGFDQQPDLLCAVVAALPSSLPRLEIHSRCTGPLLGFVGQRFTLLSRLELVGNAAGLSWAARGTAAVLPLLEHLQLTFSKPVLEFSGAMARRVDSCALPEPALAALRLTTRLRSLDLAVECSLALVQLLASAPSLRNLRLTLLGARPEHTEAIATVADALRQATHLTSLHLGLSISSYLEGDLDRAADSWDAELGEQMQLPPLGGMPHLHSLAVAGLALLPPDWRQLDRLRQLSVWPLVYEDWIAEQPYDFDQPLPALADSLTQLRLPWQALAPALCGLEGLCQLTVRGGSVALPAEVSSLTALTALTLNDDAVLQTWHARPNLVPPVAPPLGALPGLRALTIICPESRRAAWDEALEAQLGADGPSLNFVHPEHDMH